MEKELSPRRLHCSTVWKCFDDFGKHNNTSKRPKLHVYDAVVRSKLLCGFGTANITDRMLQRLGAFQLRGIHKTLHIYTIWAQRKRGTEMSNTQDAIYE